MGSNLKLLIPSGYGETLRVTGPLGARPDTEIVSGSEHCRRSHLPRTIGQMRFSFERTVHPLLHHDGIDTVHNFYFHDEFFVVTAPIRDLLVRGAAGEAEVAKVDVRYDNGTPADDAYFAVKVTRTIDCIDLAASKSHGWFSSDDVHPFELDLTSFKLGPEVSAEYANVDGEKYVSCPHWRRVKSLALRADRITREDRLFQPTLWPGHLLVTEAFAQELAGKCSGSSVGYYFWTLPLDDPNAEYRDLMHALR